MIVSYSPGRVRLRFAELKNRETAALAGEKIKKISGIRSVEINAATGSILIEFDTAALPAEKLFAMGRQELAPFNIDLDA